MHTTALKTLLLVTASIALISCSQANHKQAQQQAVDAEFANAIAEHEKNPLSAIARYEELLRTAMFSDSFSISNDTPSQTPQTENTVIAPYSAVAAELHYNLYSAYLSLYHETTASVASPQKTTIDNTDNVSALNQKIAIKTQPKNLNDAYYFAKAIWHLEKAILLPKGNLPNKTVLVKLVNEARKENDRSTKSTVDELLAHHRSGIAGKFAIIFFNLLLVFAFLTLMGRLMPHWKNLSGKPDFFFKTIAKTIDFFATSKNSDSYSESSQIDSTNKRHPQHSKIDSKYAIRFSLLALLLFCYVSSMATFVIDSQRSKTLSAITVSNNTALLKSPNSDSIKIFTLPSGEKAQLLKNQGQWYYVQVILSRNTDTREIRGWINENQLLKL